MKAGIVIKDWSEVEKNLTPEQRKKAQETTDRILGRAQDLEADLLMETNFLQISTQDILDHTRKLAKENIPMRKLALALAGVDSTDGVTSIDYKERSAALEGLAEFFIEERKRVIKYLKFQKLDHEGLKLLQQMEEDYE